MSSGNLDTLEARTSEIGFEQRIKVRHLDTLGTEQKG